MWAVALSQSLRGSARRWCSGAAVVEDAGAERALDGADVGQDFLIVHFAVHVDDDVAELGVGLQVLGRRC